MDRIASLWDFQFWLFSSDFVGNYQYQIYKTYVYPRLCKILIFFYSIFSVQKLKFRCEEQGNLNDILLRLSAFGVFIYSAFSIIAGALNALQLYPTIVINEPNLLVCVTSSVVVLQVVLQLLFIADVSRRRVHLPEHDRIKPARQVVTFLLIVNVAMFAIYTFEALKVANNPVSKIYLIKFLEKKLNICLFFEKMY